VTLSNSGPSLHLIRLLEVLAQNRVDFVVVGGSAAAFLGASRLTEDADCVVNRQRANLESLACALRELHARLRVTHMSDEESKALPIQIDATMLETLQNSTLTRIMETPQSRATLGNFRERHHDRASLRGGRSCGLGVGECMSLMRHNTTGRRHLG
jgi:hypothetical protein